LSQRVSATGKNPYAKAFANDSNNESMVTPAAIARNHRRPYKQCSNVVLQAIQIAPRRSRASNAACRSTVPANQQRPSHTVRYQQMPFRPNHSSVSAANRKPCFQQYRSVRTARRNCDGPRGAVHLCLVVAATRATSLVIAITRKEEGERAVTMQQATFAVRERERIAAVVLNFGLLSCVWERSSHKRDEW